MHPPGADTVLVRHGDLNTKSTSVKRYMEGLLVEHLEALVADRSVPGTVVRVWNRPRIETTEATIDAAVDAATDAFGVVSASPCLTVEPELSVITDTLANIAPAVYDGGSFAVDARRADKNLPFTSQAVAEAGGTAIWEAVESSFEPTVDLDDPDHTFGVEVRSETAYIYTDSVAGPGGLPLGSQAPMVALVSGGIDSPVAAYELMRRGSPVIPVYVDLGEYGGPDHEARAVETVRTLASFAPDHDLSVYRVPGGETVSHLAETMEQGRMLSLRRFFYRIAETIAADTGAQGIVTGEALGQKSSQTAQNLAVTSRATDLPIHRPLLTMDKQEIVERAREIGTYHDSTIPAGCNRIAPDRVETNGRIDPLLAVEPTDLFERADAAAADATLVSLRE
ncbi:thiamine biosynthesis protein [Halovivax asiaticus JCM 14624]|uniref:Probable tRNA sulfurtransferase n=1 Tax=Halovivax asiaticus JCM 14624 TaxID=1227490 RepID=M0BV14_9EURY|nr:tRNA sulfurtransferase [Halovivax asiaticus]ELZ13484.1 thiamine biosynthesis protein [Halovivax asiaticus JCM 14624]